MLSRIFTTKETELRQELVGECRVESSSPPSSMVDTSQDPLWRPEIRDSGKPYIFYAFFCIHICIIKFNL